MNRIEARQRVSVLPKDDLNAAFSAGLDLLRAGYAEPLIPIAQALTRRFPKDHRSHQLLGLAARMAQDSVQALQSFAQAHKLAPRDALIANSYARAALEAGRPAVPLFESAISLAPQDGTLRLGHAAALLHDGRAGDAIDLLDALTAANPLWLDGHLDAVRLRAQLQLEPYTWIKRALKDQPSSPELRMLLARTHLKAREFAEAARTLDALRAERGDSAELTMLAAHATSELGNLEDADKLFENVDCSRHVNAASLKARHLLRTERYDAVSPLLEPLIESDYDHLLWPYLSLAWRLTGDPRQYWLEGDERLVGIYDLSSQIGDLDALAALLRQRHFAQSQPLDQSVRGGTQTDGNLLLETAKPVRRLRRAVMTAVQDYVAKLPKYDAKHPTLIRYRDPLRVSGSWSVRLQDRGFHADHVHSKGWISSALYVALPDEINDRRIEKQDDASGWLALGESRDIVPWLEPLRLVQPRPGRLVLFPSTMWHGTRAFKSGERMTVAFDIARPNQL